MAPIVTLVALAFSLLPASFSSPVTSLSLHKSTPALPLGLWRKLREREARAAGGSVGEAITGGAQTIFGVEDIGFQAYEFDQLVSHDPLVPAPYPNATFKQSFCARRYWFDATYYKPGGPVFFLDGGETDGEGRLPFLKEGILRILSEATGGIGVVHEHRYYGTSHPVKNLTTDSLRYLTTLQSLHDSAYFAQNIVFPGFEDRDLTSANNKTAWIYYGGSYAGAKSAFARKLFPETWWGAIASSAVTTAVIDFWEYMEVSPDLFCLTSIPLISLSAQPIRLSGPPLCISLLQNHTIAIDALLSLNNALITSTLKSYFGLGGITLDTDFVNALQMPLGSWQARNWDADVGSREFFNFCEKIEEGELEPESLVGAEGEGVLGKAMMNLGFPNPMKRFQSFKSYAAYVKEEIASMCPEEDGEQDECFGTSVYVGEGLEEAPWRSWSYQFCTEWGYYMGAPPEGLPSLISKFITTDYTGQICKIAFPKGKINRVPNSPNVTEINQWGSYDFSYPRLAFIDGSEDPWLYATPHSPHRINSAREDTISEPFKLIAGGVHHWDENGRLDGELPIVIKKVHKEEVAFVKEWMKEWRERGRWRPE
ncbi:hypothetical protein P7C70_g3698, partial [Phenoliferia sp. Uapishka_3]